jgi:hypothetical protein
MENFIKDYATSAGISVDDAFNQLFGQIGASQWEEWLTQAGLQ